MKQNKILNAPNGVNMPLGPEYDDIDIIIGDHITTEEGVFHITKRLMYIHKETNQLVLAYKGELVE